MEVGDYKVGDHRVYEEYEMGVRGDTETGDSSGKKSSERQKTKPKLMAINSSGW